MDLYANRKLLDLVLSHKESAFNWRKRRDPEWNENYALSRDKVRVNRLTQRQSVNLPIIKYSIKTIMKDIDDAPALYFTNRDNDLQKEVFYNEYWNHSYKINKLTLKDLIDKQNVLMFGRSFKTLNIWRGGVQINVREPIDTLMDRFTDVTNIDTTRYLCYEHIYRPLTSLRLNPFYDQAAVNRLIAWYKSDEGLIHAAANSENMVNKVERMKEMGVQDIFAPKLGETYVELNEHFVMRYDKELKEDCFYFVVTADEKETLASIRLEEIIGQTQDHFWRIHIPATSWAYDSDGSDIWSDGVADTLRTPNKIVNSWVSQMVENRTLRNFGMNFYEAKEGFVPPTVEPRAGQWIPLPGKPSEVFQRVDIPDLSESLDEIKFIMDIAERASAATSTSGGNIEEKKVTLGEIQLALANAKDRVKAISALYTDSWEELGLKYTKLLEATSDMLKPVMVTKKGKQTSKLYSRIIKPEDWLSVNGYQVEVKDINAAANEDADALQVLGAAKQMMPTNQPLNTIVKRKVLEMSHTLTSSEIKEIMDFEKQTETQQAMMAQMGQQQPGMMPNGQPMNQPAQPVLPAGV